MQQWLAALPLALIAGCATAGENTVYIHPLADFSIIQRVGIMPLDNISSNPQAGEWVRQILTNEILAQGVFEVVEPWEVNRLLTEKKITAIGELSPQELAEIAESLNAQALVVGTVLQFEKGRSGTLTAPEIGISLRLLDAETALVIWSATDSRSGVTFGDRLIGTDGPDLTSATSELVRSLLNTLVSS